MGLGLRGALLVKFIHSPFMFLLAPPRVTVKPYNVAPKYQRAHGDGVNYDFAFQMAAATAER